MYEPVEFTPESFRYQKTPEIPARRILVPNQEFLLQMARIPEIVRSIGATRVTPRATRILEAFEPYMSYRLPGFFAAVAPAAVFIACAHEQIPRTIFEVASITGLIQNDLKICVNKILEKHEDFRFTAIRSEQLIPRYCESMRISRDVCTLAVRLAKYAESVNTGLASKPGTFAAAAIQIAHEELNGVRIPPGRIRAVTQVRYMRQTIAGIRCVIEGVMNII